MKDMTIFTESVKVLPLTGRLKNTFGIVPQRATLFTGTVASNLSWGKENANENEMWDSLELACAKDFIDEKSNKLYEEVLQDGKNFSGGQRQRLTIARALVKNPEILIFDDSTSALDLSTEARLHKALREKLDSTTLIIIAQRIASVMGADKIAVIEGGTIVAVGTHSQLMQSCSAYIDIYNSQLGKEENVNE